MTNLIEYLRNRHQKASVIPRILRRQEIMKDLNMFKKVFKINLIEEEDLLSRKNFNYQSWLSLNRVFHHYTSIHKLIIHL